MPGGAQSSGHLFWSVLVSLGVESYFAFLYFKRSSGINGKLRVRKLFQIREMAACRREVGKGRKLRTPCIKPGVVEHQDLKHRWNSRLQTQPAMWPAKSAATRLMPDASTRTWSGFMAWRSDRKPLETASASFGCGFHPQCQVRAWMSLTAAASGGMKRVRSRVASFVN
jgi:hypothetical protein